MTLRDCLTKFKKAFPDIPNVAYYIDNAVIPYAESGNQEYYKEYMRIISPNVFTLRCHVGFVYCLIEYNGNIFGATFENNLNGEQLHIQNNTNYDVEKVGRKLFEIFD